ncbi:MAG: TlpA disulfide reductase family protein [Methylococcales bacterium]|nr:TlpA disulfide reductase family protein [Methylococcales bacterium]
MRNRYYLTLSKGLLLSLIIGLALWPIWRGTPAPSLDLTDIHGKNVSLPAPGRPALVTFWASDCATCVKEIPALIELHQRHHHRGLDIIAVAMAYDPPNRVVNLARQHSLPYTVVLDSRATIAQAFGDVRLTPTTLLIDAQGHIQARILGDWQLDAISARIQPWLPTP